MTVARVLGAALVATAAFVSSASPATRSTSTVSIANFSYTPTPVTVNVNDTVHWVWAQGFHSTTSGTCTGGTCTAGPGWDSMPQSAPTATFDHQFTSAGTFHYFCTVHGASMQGDVIVNNPTSATFTAFAARRATRGVAVTWKTASAIDVLGYTVFRQLAGRRTQVSNLIVARGETGPASYRFLDRPVHVTAGLRYLLQVIHANGARTWFGAAAVH